MAQTIVGFSLAPFKEVSSQAKRFTLADQAATTAIQDLGSAAFRSATALISVKTFVVGTGTVGPIFSVQASSSATFASDVVDVATYQPDLSSLTAGAFGKAAGYVVGIIPDNTAREYWRVKVTFSGTSTGTYDVDVAIA